VTIIGAAGDRNKYSCSVTPAFSRSVITVAATSRGADLEVPESNFGECIQIFAPGEALPTAAIGSPAGGLIPMTGSSASAAIVTGIWSSLLRVYSDPQSLTLQAVGTEGNSAQEDAALTDADRLMLLKDSLLHPGIVDTGVSSHEVPWIGCEFTSPAGVLRHMNERYSDWKKTKESMRKFMDPRKRREFLLGRA
jgi:hypothetical protein